MSNKPKKVFFVSASRADGDYISMYKRKGGMFSRESAAVERANDIRKSGWDVKVYEAEVVWKETAL